MTYSQLFQKILSRSRFIAIYLVGCASVLVSLSVLLFTQPEGTGWDVLYAILLVLIGFGWGFSFTLFPTITSESFGPANFGICNSYVNLGSLLASLTIPYYVGWLVDYDQ